MDGNDVSTRTLAVVPDEPTPQFTEEPEPNYGVPGDEHGYVEKDDPEARAPYAAYQSVKFIEVLGQAVPLEVAKQVFADLGEALVAADADAGA